MSGVVRADGITVYVNPSGLAQKLDCRECPIKNIAGRCRISGELRITGSTCDFNLTAEKSRDLALNPDKMQGFLKEIGH